MKKKVIEILLILIGIILIAYPIISACVSSYNQTVAISNYQEKVSSLSDEEKKEELQKARDYNNELEQVTVVDISMSGSTEEKEYVSYLNVLNIGDAMAYISIPKINVYLPIYHGISEDVLQSGVGHLENTSLPVGGKGTHAVLSGHTGLVRTKIFDDINKLEIGDKFYIDVLGEQLAYEVDKIDVVLPDNTDVIKVDPDKDYITLLTCTPYMINSHRLLVRGSRVEIEEIQNEDESQIPSAEPINQVDMENLKENKMINIIISIIIFIIVIIVFMIYILYEKKKKKRKRKISIGKHIK